MPKNRIHKRSDGRYIYSATDALGKTKQLTQRKHENYEAFRSRCNELDKRIATLAGSNKLTYDELFSEWTINRLSRLSESHQASTNSMYQNHIKDTLGHLYLHEITTNKIFNLLQEKINHPYSKEYVSKIRSCISAPFTYALKAGLYSVNPVSDIRLTYTAENQPKPVNRHLSEDEIEMFFEQAEDSKYINYYKLLLVTGTRPSEGLGLQFADISDNKINIERAITAKGLSAGKNMNAKRKLPNTEKTKQILLEQENNTKWLFPSAEGSPNMEAIKSDFDRIKRKLDFQITLYSFRHTFATKMARAGMKPKTLQYILGHKKITTTYDYYVGIEDEDLAIANDLISSVF